MHLVYYIPFNDCCMIIVYSILIAIFCYLLSSVLDAWMDEGHILRWYYNWLLKIGRVTFDKDGTIIGSFRQFINPLGFCRICCNVWLTMIVFILISLFICPMNLVVIIPTIVLSNYLTIKF